MIKVRESEDWAPKKGFVNMRFTIGTRGLPCRMRHLGKPWEELMDIYTVDRAEYNWFL